MLHIAFALTKRSASTLTCFCLTAVALLIYQGAAPSSVAPAYTASDLGALEEWGQEPDSVLINRSRPRDWALAAAPWRVNYPPDATWCRVYAANRSGQAAGSAKIGGYEHAVLWSRAGAMTDLGAPVGASGGQATSRAFALNDNGQVVGCRQRGVSGAYHAFFYDGGKMHDLGTVPGSSGGNSSQAYGINNAGDVVGAAGNGNYPVDETAFLWHEGRLRNLNHLIRADSGWQLMRACTIDEHGRIRGEGLLWGQPHAFLLTRTPPPLPTPTATAAPPILLAVSGAGSEERPRLPQ